MAAVTATNTTAYGFSTPAGPKTLATYSGGAVQMKTCLFACAFTGTYAQSTGYTLSWANDIAAAIKTAMRDGGTITVWDVSAAAPGIENVTQVVPGVTASSAGATTGLIYGADGTTEHANAAMVGFTDLMVFSVTFLDSLPA